MRISTIRIRILPVFFACLLLFSLAAPVFAQPDPFEWDNLLAMLKSDNPLVRFKAVQTLRVTHEPRALEPLIGMLQDPDFGVWSTALDGLSWYPSEKIINPLLIAASDCDDQRAYRYSSTLSNLGVTAESLLARMKSADVNIRAGALRVLPERTLSKSNIIAAVIAGITDPQPLVRAAAINTSLFIKDKATLARAEGPVRAACGDKVARVRQAAFSTLFKWNKKTPELLLVALKDESPLVRYVGLKNLAGSKDPRLKELVAAAVKDGDAQVRAAAFGALAILQDRPRQRELSLSALRDESPDVRAAALHVFWLAQGVDGWRPEVAELLHDNDFRVRQMAAWALAAIEDREHAADYLSMLNDPVCKQAGFFALGLLRDVRVLPRLIDIVKYDEDHDYHGARWTLSRFGPAANDALMKSNDPRLVSIALWNGDPCALAWFHRELPKADENNKYRILVTLADQGDLNLEPLFIAELPHADMRYMTMLIRAFAWSQSPETAKALVALVKPGGRLAGKQNDEYRRQVYLSLANMECTIARDFLLSRMQKEDKKFWEEQFFWGFTDNSLFRDPRVIPTAIKMIAENTGKGVIYGINTPYGILDVYTEDVLASISTVVAKKALTALFRDKDPRVQLIAAIALGRADKAAATPILLRNISHPDERIRIRVLMALCGMGDARGLLALGTLLKNKPVLWNRLLTDSVLCCGPAGEAMLFKMLAMPKLDSSLRSYLIDDLLKRNNKRAIAMLVNYARIKDPQIASIAKQHLKNLPDPHFLNYWVELLNSPNDKTCMMAAEMLGEIGDKRAIAPLRAAMKRNKCSSAIMLARAYLHDPIVADEALKLYDPNKPDISLLYLCALVGDKRALEPALAQFVIAREKRRSYLYDQRISACMSMINGSPNYNSQYEAGTPARLIEILGMLGDARAVDPLIAGLRDEIRYNSEYSEMSNYYIDSLSKIGDVRAIKPIVEAMERFDIDSFDISVEALARMNADSAFPDILRKAACSSGYDDIFSDDFSFDTYDPIFYYQYPENDRETGKLLGQFHGTASAEALKAALQNGMWRTRMTATRALGYRGEEWCAEAVLPLLKDTQPQVRAAAAEALARLKAVTARAEIEKLLTDPYPEVREAARKALK